MFGKWFGKKEEKTRILEKPEELNVGDMVEMVDSFGLPAEIRGETFQIMEINTYEYKHARETEFLLQGSEGIPLHLTVEVEDGEEWLNFTRKIERSDVEQLFDMDAFGLVFDEEVSRESIRVIGDSSKYERWLADSYYQEGEWTRGYFHKSDFRKKSISRYEDDDNGEAFESVSLVSEDDMHRVEIEVWEDGTTDVSIGVSRPIADIKALYGKT
ncbi:hypothetical protein [Pleionea sediminis]|uniref:hypothetical protein n=1 Tax=Pleionea sediminis TaxID=2569479 RepID=UPI00118672BE|nr:hypothetical protein [Pleionea sediminis]